MSVRCVTQEMKTTTFLKKKVEIYWENNKRKILESLLNPICKVKLPAMIENNREQRTLIDCWEFCLSNARNLPNKEQLTNEILWRVLVLGYNQTEEN